MEGPTNPMKHLQMGPTTMPLDQGPTKASPGERTGPEEPARGWPTLGPAHLALHFHYRLSMTAVIVSTSGNHH